MDVLRNINEKFSEDKKNYEAKIRELEQDYDMSEDAIKSKERRIHALDVKLSKSNEDLEKKMKCLEMEYNLKVQELEATVGELSKKCQDTVKKNEESEEKIKELKGKFKERSQKKDSMERENHRLKKENFSLKKENDLYKKEYDYLRIKYSNKKNQVEFLEGEVFGRTGEKSTRVKVEKCAAGNKRPGEYFEPECSEEKRSLRERVTENTEEETTEAGATNGNGTEAPEKGDTAAGTTEQRLS